MSATTAIQHSANATSIVFFQGRPLPICDYRANTWGEITEETGTNHQLRVYRRPHASNWLRGSGTSERRSRAGRARDRSPLEGCCIETFGCSMGTIKKSASYEISGAP